MKVAIVYDRVNKWGGAEKVLLALHEIFPDAPLYTSVYDKKNASWAKAFPKIYTSFLQRLPFAKGNHELLGTFMPLAFESFNFDAYDLVISVTSEAAKGIVTGPSTYHLCYCLTPTRYLWSHYDEYFKNTILRIVSKPFVKYLKFWDKLASQRPDMIVPISSHVKKRVVAFYGKSGNVIHPPFDASNRNKRKKSKKSYYLVVGRMVRYKKTDLVVDAFNSLGLPLVVVGDGRELKNLKRKAKSNIKFTGFVTDAKLARYYSQAKALIMPQEEDYGIVSVEAQHFGVPVIAYKISGAKDTVKHGVTGILFDKQTSKSLKSAIYIFEKMSKYSFKDIDLFNNAKNFSKSKFQKKFVEIIKKSVKIV